MLFRQGVVMFGKRHDTLDKRDEFLEWGREFLVKWVKPWILEVSSWVVGVGPWGFGVSSWVGGESFARQGYVLADSRRQHRYWWECLGNVSSGVYSLVNADPQCWPRDMTIPTPDRDTRSPQGRTLPPKNGIFLPIAS